MTKDTSVSDFIIGMVTKTKQEEIDWGIRSFLCDAFNCDEDHYLAVKSLELRQYLAREGVVIKVDDVGCGCELCLDGTGYSNCTVESLVKE